MKEFEVGGLVLSMAGRDKGNLFVILKLEQDYLILADGRSRTVEHPKRKKKKHVQYIGERCGIQPVREEASGWITNERLKYELKKYRHSQNGGFYV